MIAVTIEKLEALAATTRMRADARKARQTAPSSRSHDNGHLDVPKYLSHHRIGILKVKEHQGSTLYILKDGCLFDPGHTKGEAAIGQTREGKLFSQCFHVSCKDKTWHDVRAKISGDAPLDEFMSGWQKTDSGKPDSTPTPASNRAIASNLA